MKELTFVQFTGGLDSTYIMYNILSGKYESNLDNLYILYVNSKNINQKQQENEKKSIKKIFNYLKNKYSLSIDLNNTLCNMNVNVVAPTYPDGDSSIAEYSGQGIMWIGSAMQMIGACKPDVITFYNGALKSDSFQSIVYNKKSIIKCISNITNNSVSCNFKFPLCNYTKTQIIDFIINEDINLLEYISFCENGKCINTVHTLCDSCINFYKSFMHAIQTSKYSRDLILKLKDVVIKYYILIDIDDNNLIIKIPKYDNISIYNTTYLNNYF